MDDLLKRLETALDRAGEASSDFDLNPPSLTPKGRDLRPAAVLAAIDMRSTPRLILTKRSSALKHHPGQIAFPGGKKDIEDKDLAATALRESQEEIGLPKANVRVLGHLPDHETVTGFCVRPFIGVFEAPFTPVPEKGEVQEVFSVPLSHVLTVSRFQIEGRQWQGRFRRYYTIPYGPYYIWGATARMLRAWAEAMT